MIQVELLLKSQDLADASYIAERLSSIVVWSASSQVILLSAKTSRQSTSQTQTNNKIKDAVKNSSIENQFTISLSKPKALPTCLKLNMLERNNHRRGVIPSLDSFPTHHYPSSTD